MKIKKVALLMSVLALAGMSGATIIHQDDFSGVVTDAAKDSVPELSQVGFIPASSVTGLDGNGRLETTSSTSPNANYRFRIAANPLTDDTSITEISYTVTMRTPTNDWVMIGFQENNANGFLTEAVNAGPFVQFNPGGGVILRGGTWGGGNISPTFYGNYTLGEVITTTMTFHVGAGTIDLAINGSTVTNGFALNHELPVGTLSDPVVNWMQFQLRNQPSAANGGAYIDSVQVSTIPEPAALGMIGFAGISILFIRRKLSM